LYICNNNNFVIAGHVIHTKGRSVRNTIAKISFAPWICSERNGNWKYTVRITKEIIFSLIKNTTWQKTDRQVPLLRKLWRDGKWPTSTAG